MKHIVSLFVVLTMLFGVAAALEFVPGYGHTGESLINGSKDVVKRFLDKYHKNEQFVKSDVLKLYESSLAYLTGGVMYWQNNDMVKKDDATAMANAFNNALYGLCFVWKKYQEAEISDGQFMGGALKLMDSIVNQD